MSNQTRTFTSVSIPDETLEEFKKILITAYPSLKGASTGSMVKLGLFHVMEDIKTNKLKNVPFPEGVLISIK